MERRVGWKKCSVSQRKIPFEKQNIYRGGSVFKHRYNKILSLYFEKKHRFLTTNSTPWHDAKSTKGENMKMKILNYCFCKLLKNTDEEQLIQKLINKLRH